MQASRPLTVAGAAQVATAPVRRHPSCFPFNLAGRAADQSTNEPHANRGRRAGLGAGPGLQPGSQPQVPGDRHLQWSAILEAAQPMSRLDDLAERIERLVLRHEELQRTNVLLEQQVASLTGERDSLRSRLAAARARIDALLDRLPTDAAPAVAAVKPSQDAA